MECLKCGRETQGKDVFCPGCLKVMAASPVKAGTTVTLPQRDKIARKSQSRKQIKPEEQIARLKSTVRRLRIAVAVLAVSLAVVAGAFVFRLAQPQDAPSLGQNYNTSDTGITSGTTG